MNKILSLILLMYFMLVHSSCITSLHPLVTSDIAVTEKKIEGNWTNKDMQFSIERVQDTLIRRIITDKNYPNRTNDSILLSRAYMASYKKDGINYGFQLALTRINGNLFMHLAPAGFEPGIDSIKWMKRYGQRLVYLPTYTIAKLQIANSSTLIIKFLDGEYIKQQVDAGKVMIRHEEDKLFDMFLITASSQELQQFLRKYGDDERLYIKDVTVLHRKDTENVSKKKFNQ